VTHMVKIFVAASRPAPLSTPYGGVHVYVLIRSLGPGRPPATHSLALSLAAAGRFGVKCGRASAMTGFGGRMSRRRCPASRAASGLEDRFRPPSPSDRCRRGEATFARMCGNGRDAPKPDTSSGGRLRRVKARSLRGTSPAASSHSRKPESARAKHATARVDYCTFVPSPSAALNFGECRIKPECHAVWPWIAHRFNNIGYRDNFGFY
jgi:hypothetical protein